MDKFPSGGGDPNNRPRAKRQKDMETQTLRARSPRGTGLPGGGEGSRRSAEGLTERRAGAYFVFSKTPRPVAQADSRRGWPAEDLCVCVCVRVSECACVCACVTVCVCECACLRVLPGVPVSLCLFVSVRVCHWVSVSLCLSLCVLVSGVGVSKGSIGTPQPLSCVTCCSEAQMLGQDPCPPPTPSTHQP